MRAGGESGKLGARYEGIWTVSQILRLLREEAAAITLEPLDDPEGIEFVLELPSGEREYHSVKRNAPGRSSWTPGEFAKKRNTKPSILDHLAGKLRGDPRGRAVFVSGSSADWLHNLAADMADRAPTLAEFRQRLDESDRAVSDFDLFQRKSGSSSSQEAFDLLRRFRVQTVSEPFLLDSVGREISSLVYAPPPRKVDPLDLRLDLADWLIAERLGVRSTAHDVWQHLVERGFHRRDWSAPGPLSQQLRAEGKHFQERIESDLVNGRRIPRHDMVQKLAEALRVDDSTAILLAGQAGYGKSCVLAQLVDQLDAEQTPHVALRLTPAISSTTTHALGAELLDSDLSPVVALAGLAEGRRSVVIIDQLDVASASIGARERLWALFDRLRAEVAAYPGMRLVLACRSFDLEHDHRLRQLLNGPNPARRLDLGLLPTAAVDQALREGFGDVPALTSRQRAILAVPLHLHLYIQARNDGFEAPLDLFQAFWDRKRKHVEDRLAPQLSQWDTVIDRITSTMSECQGELSIVHEALEDQFGPTIRAMASEFVLAREGDRYRFFHDSFFDYAFARRFFGQGKDLVSDLLVPRGQGESQHLFRRSQVRQILAYQRQRDLARYRETLERTLMHPEVRFHIKALVLDWLHSQNEPHRDEWAAIKRFAASSPDRLRLVTRAVWGKLPWIDLLASEGVLLEWLGSPDEATADTALRLLIHPDVLRDRSATVAILLRPFLGQGEIWNRRFQFLVSYLHAIRGRDLFDLFLDAIGAGVVDDFGPGKKGAPRLLFEDLEDHDPAWVAEALAAWFDRQIAVVKPEDQGALFNGHDSSPGRGTLASAAAKAPEAFVSLLLPRLADFMATTARARPDGKLSVDCIGLAGCQYGSREFMTPLTELFEAAAEAMATLANTDPDKLDDMTSTIVDRKEEPLAYLLLRGWQANPQRYADRAAEYLLQDHSRLDIDTEDGSAAASRQAVAAITPHCSAAAATHLEAVILDFTTSWERDTPRWRGRHQLGLLRAFAADRLSPKGRARLRELERKFPDAHEEPSFRITVGFVGSPIPKDNTERMRDEDWLSAMRKYPAHD